MESKSKVVVDKERLDFLINKYASVSEEEFNDFVKRTCSYYSTMEQDKLEKYGFVEGKKNEFFERIKEMILFVQEDYVKREYLPVEREKFVEIPGLPKEEQLKEIRLPYSGKLISEFIIEMVEEIKDSYELFFRQESFDVVEINSISKDNDFYTGFIPVRPNRFITLIEKYIIPGENIWNRKKDEWEFKSKSISGDLANTIIQSKIFQLRLPRIERIFTVPIPIMYEGKLAFPEKGYDSRFHSFLDFSAPAITDEMGVELAKEILDSVLKEFCFQEKKDYVNAIAAMITPFVRGLFSNFNVRTPLWIYLANRERAGKDYLAGITGILYEGFALEEPPICVGEKDRGNNEELKKKILSAMISGRKRLHFSNNKGFLNNSVLEAVITAVKYSDRVLGKNSTLTFDNEIDYSLSGNVGIGFTPDLANRSKFIRLFLDIEDANSRRFDNPNLHNWVRENRGTILSALYALVKDWVDKGMKKGKIPFASFHEWSEVVGGIMENAGYENPCSPDKELLLIGGDTETSDMKRLFELCNEKFSSEQWVTKKEIKNLIKDSGEDVFVYYDFDKREDETKFGLKLTKFIGRVLSGIRMIVDDSNIRSARQKFRFAKEEDLLKRELIKE